MAVKSDMGTDADHVTILCGECGLELYEACSSLCLGWVNREEIEDRSPDVRVITSYRTSRGLVPAVDGRGVPVPPHVTCLAEQTSYTQYYN